MGATTEDINSSDFVIDLLTTHKCDYEIIEKWLSLTYKYNSFYLNRIYDWLYFFDCIFINREASVFFIDAGNLFEYSTLAVFELIKDEEWLAQSETEFEISKCFYIEIQKHGNLHYFKNKDEALYFLKTSIVYSYYKDFVKTSLIDASEGIAIKTSIDKQAQFFKAVFSRYQNCCSLVLYRTLLYMSLEDISIFMKLIHGKSLRQIDRLPKKFSKKQVHYFLCNLPKYLPYKSGVFKSGWYYSKLLMLTNDPIFLYQICNALHKTERRYDQFFANDFDYWEGVYFYLHNNESQIGIFNEKNGTHISLDGILDYLFYKKYTVREKVHLKHKHMRNLCFEVINWETRYFEQLQKPKKKITWGKHKETSWSCKTKEGYFKIDEIRDSDSLHDESVTMRHCVFSYLRGCISEHIQIFSMQKLEATKSIKLLTISVSNNRLTEAKGKYNRHTTDTEQHILQQWSSELGFQYH